MISQKQRGDIYGRSANLSLAVNESARVWCKNICALFKYLLRGGWLGNTPIYI